MPRASSATTNQPDPARRPRRCAASSTALVPTTARRRHGERCFRSPPVTQAAHRLGVVAHASSTRATSADCSPRPVATSRSTTMQRAGRRRASERTTIGSASRTPRRQYEPPTKPHRPPFAQVERGDQRSSPRLRPPVTAVSASAQDATSRRAALLGMELRARSCLSTTDGLGRLVPHPTQARGFRPPARTRTKMRSKAKSRVSAPAPANTRPLQPIPSHMRHALRQRRARNRRSEPMPSPAPSSLRSNSSLQPRQIATHDSGFRRRARRAPCSTPGRTAQRQTRTLRPPGSTITSVMTRRPASASRCARPRP